MKCRIEHYPHKAHPPWSTATLLTMRMHRRFICSKGSMPSILPAARAFALRCALLSIWKLVWQYLQYQESLGMHGRGTQSEIDTFIQLRTTKRNVSLKSKLQRNKHSYNSISSPIVFSNYHSSNLKLESRVEIQ